MFVYLLRCGDGEERAPWTLASVTMKRGRTTPTRLELLLWLEEDFRICLEPIHMTPVHAGALLFLRRYEGAKLTDAATLLGLTYPAVNVLVIALERMAG